MHVVGTAGHVDHGKSSLVRALTGTDPDRWIEERLRGMTLDLGFAHLRFDDGVEAGIVDVPGHERFLHNMLAGAAGMELLLLVVAANEGVRPQTVEHLAILDLLGVRRSIVVLSKRDLVDDDLLRVAQDEVRAAIAGTVADGAPAIAVSTLTGEGLDVLRTAIHEALAALPPRAPQAPPFLPVDRVFAVAGHGTVVTGTLLQGTLRAGDVVRVQPPGRDLRVRGLHVFNRKRDVVEGGARVAVNLAGIDVGELHRGAVVADPQFTAVTSVAVRFRPVPGGVALLRRRTPVRAAIGAAEIVGTLVLEPNDLARLSADASTSVEATLHLRRPAVTFPGQPFVVRGLSPKTLVGGGTLGGSVDGEPAPSASTSGLARVLAESKLAPRTATELGALANLRAEHAAELLEELVASGGARRLHKPVAFVDGAAAQALAERVLEALARRETQTPWIVGTTSILLARELGVDEPFLIRFLAAEAEDGRIASRAGYYASPGHLPRLSDEQRAFFEDAVPVDPAQPLVPAALDAVVAAVRTSRIAGLAQAFDTLLATGALVKVGGEVYRGTQIAEIRRRLAEAIRRDGPITLAAFRDAVGTSRKYAVPLMEWFDATGVTVRDGDRRALRRAPAPVEAVP